MFTSFESFYDRARKRWTFNTGDCSIEVTSWDGLTVYFKFNTGDCSIEVTSWDGLTVYFKQSPVLNLKYTVKPSHDVTSIEQSPVLKVHLFLVLLQKIS
jgi:hypothetical protein